MSRYAVELRVVSTQWVTVEAATKDEAWRKAEAVVDPFEGDIEIVEIEYSGE